MNERRYRNDVADNRPRHTYTLPDGRDVRIIFDHGDDVPEETTYTLETGEVVVARRRSR